MLFTNPPFSFNTTSPPPHSSGLRPIYADQNNINLVSIQILPENVKTIIYGHYLASFFKLGHRKNVIRNPYILKHFIKPSEIMCLKFLSNPEKFKFFFKNLLSINNYCLQINAQNCKFYKFISKNLFIKKGLQVIEFSETLSQRVNIQLESKFLADLDLQNLLKMISKIEVINDAQGNSSSHGPIRVLTRKLRNRFILTLVQNTSPNTVNFFCTQI